MSGSHDYDVIVVGTGYGGASAAESLARAGLKVGILERGTWWGAFEGHRPLPETLPQIVAALYGFNLSGLGRSLRIPLSRRGLIEVSLHGGTIVLNSAARRRQLAGEWRAICNVPLPNSSTRCRPN